MEKIEIPMNNFIIYIYISSQVTRFSQINLKHQINSISNVQVNSIIFQFKLLNLFNPLIESKDKSTLEVRFPHIISVQKINPFLSEHKKA